MEIEAIVGDRLGQPARRFVSPVCPPFVPLAGQARRQIGIEAPIRTARKTGMVYAMQNKPQAEMTASPSKYPQGYFRPKPCRECGGVFQPQAPSHLACSQECANRMLTGRYLQRNYRITLRQYEDLRQKQAGLCAICGSEGFVMTSHHKMKLVVDHCHASGQVRGLLCHNCNRALGLLKDSDEVLQRAIKYLRTTRPPSQERQGT